ncbi:hypothetical protein BDV93DRAFT_561158 [Ceratobasidium sp. AG-I]|nr:hypothetical protein BDV93DRAFT_561158 [Ceratobasidium sp. AG-I]
MAADYVEVMSGSHIFESFPLLFPGSLNGDLLEMTEDIVGAIAEIAKNEKARHALCKGGVMQKLLPLLKPPKHKSKLILGVLRAVNVMSESGIATNEITQEHVSAAVEFTKSDRKSRVIEAIRFIAVLAKHEATRVHLTQEAAPRLISLLSCDHHPVVEEAIKAIAVIGQYDESVLSANVQEVTRTLVSLAQTLPSASRGIASLTDHKLFRAAFMEGETVKELKLALGNKDATLVRETIRLVLKLAQHDDSRSELASHNVTLELIHLLDSEALSKEVANAIEQLTRFPELLNAELIESLVGTLKPKQEPCMTLAIVRVAAHDSRYHEMARNLVSDLFELLKDEDGWLSDNDGELAASARDLALNVVALGTLSSPVRDIHF